MRVTRVLCMVVVLAVLSSTLFAGYWDNVSRKADRGFSNVLGCWLEIPYQTYAMSMDKGILAGAPMGLGKGIVMVPLRIVSGAADLLSFYMPCPKCGWNGMVQPEYNPWVEEPEKPMEMQPASRPLPEPVEQPAPAK